ncbi:hypothetical protein RYX36_016201 [Vicia faba]
MASIATFFNKFCYLFILILHLGCFMFTTAAVTAGKQKHDTRHLLPSKKRKILPLSQPTSPSHPKFKTHKALSSSWHFVKHLFSAKSCKTAITAATTQASPQSTSTTAEASQQSLISLVQSDPSFTDPPRKKQPESDISADNFPLRNDIFPCTVCGEIFQKPNLLENHQFTNHAVSELTGSDPGHNIVQIIFKSGWPETNEFPFPTIHRILKIHNSQKILSKFEEYREMVKSKATRNTRRRDERCIADGNELMRFHCSTFLCELGHNGDSSICSQQFCTICGIIKSGFSQKLDGISTLSTSWRANMSIPDDIEREFRFMNVKRAMLVCRVIAGRVGSDSDDEMDKTDGGFDSVMARGESELVVFNPRAVLPCFVIVYSV